MRTRKLEVFQGGRDSQKRLKTVEPSHRSQLAASQRAGNWRQVKAASQRAVAGGKEAPGPGILAARMS